MDFTKLFSIQAVVDHDLAILKYSNFLEFLKFLPESELIKFEQYQKLICPQIESKEFKLWTNHVIGVLEITQSDLCTTLKITASKFSNFLNNEAELTLEQKFALKNELKRQMITKGFMKP